MTPAAHNEAGLAKWATAEVEAPNVSTDERSGFDSIKLEVWWSRLVAIVDEAATALLRTAFSTIIRESNDYTVVLTNASGESIAECNAGIPAFAVVMGRLVRSLLERFPLELWRDGDCVITNDPWLGTGHLPDVAVVTPIFFSKRLVGFAATAAHVPDIGSTAGMGVTDPMAEGLLIPPVYLYRGGALQEGVLDLFMGNVRLARQVRGDIQAQLAAHEVCRQRTISFMDETGHQDLVELSSALHDRAERGVSRALDSIPDGSWESVVESDGAGGLPTVINCRVSKAGNRLSVDYTGSSLQSPYPINCTLNYTLAYTVYPLKILLDPSTRRNHGSYKAFRISAPPGSILNAGYPAPVGARHLTGHLLSCAVYQAMAPVLPSRVIADSGGSPALRVRLFGTKPDGDSFILHLFASAGMGASSSADGLSTTAFPTNSGAGSLEALEVAAPILFTRKEYRVDSGGPGTYRGGLGQDIEMLNASGSAITVALLGDRETHPAQGILGGSPGSTAEVKIAGRDTPLKSVVQLEPGETIAIAFPGGGGYGPAEARSMELIASDVDRGFVSESAGREIFTASLSASCSGHRPERTC